MSALYYISFIWLLLALIHVVRITRCGIAGLLYFWKVDVFSVSVFSYRRFTDCYNNVAGQPSVQNRPSGIHVPHASVERRSTGVPRFGSFCCILVISVHDRVGLSLLCNGD